MTNKGLDPVYTLDFTSADITFHNVLEIQSYSTLSSEK